MEITRLRKTDQQPDPDIDRGRMEKLVAILHKRICNSTAVKCIRRFLGISFIVETWPRMFKIVT